MSEIKIITHETVPCWYELSWRGRQGEPGIVLRIHREYSSRFQSILPDAPAVADFKTEFRFAKFAGSLENDFGFKRSLRYLGFQKDFLEYVVPLPLCRKVSDNPCEWCKGSGQDEFLDRECLHCEGGRTVSYDWREAFAVSASLTVLLAAMAFPNSSEETHCSLPQLLTVQTITMADSHGGSLTGMYSRELVAYLRAYGPRPIPEMIAAMRTVYERMEGRFEEFHAHSFNAWVADENGWLNVSCPGDAAGLHPARSSWMRVGEGYEFSCHNVDNPMQQLMLLASLAALHDLARTSSR